VMDHRVLEHYGGDITRVNVHPRVHDKVMARYGVRDERWRVGAPPARRAGGEQRAEV
jgi:alkane 1-monooxygenase